MKLLSKTLLTVMFSLSAATVSAQTMRIATDSGAQGSPSGDAIEKWAALIKEGTQGAVSPRVFYQNQLGGQEEVFDQHVAGDVQLMLNWPMTSYDKRIAVIYTPYMFTTWEEALAAYQPGGWLNETLDGIYKENGLKFFGAWPEGFNGVATKGKHAVTVEDAKNIKVRVPPISMMQQSVQAMGYQTAAIDWGEVFTSIQTGVVDGDAANVIYYDYEYFRDTLDYYVRSKQQFITGVLSMNLEAWEALKPEQQEVIQASATTIMQDQFSKAQVADAAIVEKWKALGKNYVELDKGQLAALGTHVRSKVWPSMHAEVGDSIMAHIEKNASALK
ncbi:TRAP transporter substrate-binding protein DctP [Alcaligenes faecalis]|uniref:TRAP transporter substrate-binding protein DctP n=1 Tax=Alcaligenes faecalis TaxID=511 RepID=UPI001C83F494|nr:TRAP transporter substrate-binding protein DctP [Alcaligenes faecalis]MBX6965331.1 C4-dicarboxylate ABC transporter substrate-binding protein [Providencia rettgeri]MBX7030966.1 C4-dicarboxylate ABC transporter substrate-binding protein [Alcaligenes faecalis]